jgi:tetratricopeptide (TPR) repeat protein
MQPKISLCMIVRNEETNLVECLSGVSGLFDEIILVDTGSTDGTRAVAERLGARVFDFAWVDDFAAARNESRRHATGEWIFWLDADDRIDPVNRQRLADLFDRLGAPDAGRNPVFMVSCLSNLPGRASADRMSQARLFANHAKIHWAGAVHERLDCMSSGDSMTLHPTDVEIRHLGYSDPEEFARKQFRDLRLLEREYLVNPDDPLTLYYLARIHHTQGQYGQAVRLARRAIRLDPHGEILSTPQTFLILAESLAATGALAEALSAYDEGAARYPEYSYLTHKRGCLLFHLGKLPEAEACFRTISAQGPQAIWFTSAPNNLYREMACLMLARVHLMQRRWKDADALLRQFVQMQSGCVEAWELLAMANLALGRLNEVRGVIQSLASIAGTEAERFLLQARLAIAEGRLNDARRCIDQAMGVRPDAAAAWVVLCDLLFTEGVDRQRCISAHRKALMMQPNMPELRQRLNRMLQEETRQPTGRKRAASLSAFEVPAGRAFVA